MRHAGWGEIIGKPIITGPIDSAFTNDFGLSASGGGGGGMRF